MDYRRRALMVARKRINPTVYFGVEHLGGRMVRYTCKSCGRQNEEIYGGEKGPTDERFISRMVTYQNQPPGVSGHCPRCTKRARDEAYPLGDPPV